VQGPPDLLELKGKPFLGIVAPQEVERAERFRAYERIWTKNQKVKAKEVRRDVKEALRAVQEG